MVEPSCRPTARRVAALAGCAALLATQAACSRSGARSAIPSFHPAPGRFRLVPQPTHGAPPPQTLAFRGHRVLATLGGVEGSATRARVDAVFQVADEKALVPDRRYRAGDAVLVGTVRVRIDAIYGSGEQHIAVDVTLS